ncbi:predicted protein [Nematostella vectensis]|uniref:Ig-like domain-containing protein n=2 Tax=Nematostella vectensis TaxID=45351 RepID=A7RVU2_NEMVE|nr:predicted protein [Nematostella vectensis]|eukprot:XP_001636509.1 predicted protein [Nematostella vectensis]
MGRQAAKLLLVILIVLACIANMDAKGRQPGRKTKAARRKGVTSLIRVTPEKPGTLLVGSSINLACSSDQVVNLTWSKDGSLRSNDTTLTLINLQSRDRGVYVCSGHDQNGTSLERRVKIKVKRKMPGGLQVTVKSKARGNRISITCKVKGARKPLSIIWKKDNQKLVCDDKKSRPKSSLKCKQIQKKNVYVLKLSRGNRIQGSFSCHARSGKATGKGIVHLPHPK